jgi:hypothetical protein
MSTKFMDWCRDYQGAISFVLIIMLLGFAAGISRACANELPEGLNGEMIEIPVICGDTMVMYRELLDTHGEVPVAIGFTDRDTAVVWFTNEDRTTLSVVIDTPGRSCMIYTSTCYEGDCYMTPEENYEREKEKMLDNNESPKVSM